MGYRIATVLILLLPFLCGTGCGREESPDASIEAPGPTIAIADDDGGEITDWLLSAADGDREAFLPTLAEIVARAAPEIRFHILVSAKETRRTLTRLLTELGFGDFYRIRWRETGTEMSWWIRDLFVTGTSGGSDRVLLLHHPSHYGSIQRTMGGNGPETLRILRSLAGFRAVDTRAHIEGGAVVADDRHVFVTPQYGELAVRMGEFPDWSAFLTYLRELYGRPALMLDVPPESTWDHADMYLTPIGDETLILGDPALAAEILRNASPTSFRCLADRVARLDGAPEGDRSGTGITPEIIRDSVTRTRLTDEITARLVRQLRYLGYRIVRVPLLILRLPNRVGECRLTYNNVILERRGGRRIVYLPSYGIPELDRAARKVWELQGFEVIGIDALGPATRGGGVRCLSQVFRK